MCKVMPDVCAYKNHIEKHSHFGWYTIIQKCHFLTHRSFEKCILLLFCAKLESSVCENEWQ